LNFFDDLICIRVSNSRAAVAEARLEMKITWNAAGVVSLTIGQVRSCAAPDNCLSFGELMKIKESAARGNCRPPDSLPKFAFFPLRVS
jgi:hypothetical protein